MNGWSAQNTIVLGCFRFSGLSLTDPQIVFLLGGNTLVAQSEPFLRETVFKTKERGQYLHNIVVSPCTLMELLMFVITHIKLQIFDRVR